MADCSPTPPPCRVLMRAGKWLVPEDQRPAVPAPPPDLKPRREITGGNRICQRCQAAAAKIKYCTACAADMRREQTSRSISAYRMLGTGDLRGRGLEALARLILEWERAQELCARLEERIRRCRA